MPRPDPLIDSLLVPQSRCCKAPLRFEQLSGTRVFREVKKRKVFTARCSKCQREHTLDGGKA